MGQASSRFLTEANADLTMRLWTTNPPSGVWRIQMADQVNVDVWYDYA